MNDELGTKRKSKIYSDFQLGETFKSERGRLVRQRSEMTLLAYPPASLLVSGLSRAKRRSMRTSRPRSDSEAVRFLVALN